MSLLQNFAWGPCKNSGQDPVGYQTDQANNGYGTNGRQSPMGNWRKTWHAATPPSGRHRNYGLPFYDP